MTEEPDKTVEEPEVVETPAAEAEAPAAKPKRARAKKPAAAAKAETADAEPTADDAAPEAEAKPKAAPKPRAAAKPKAAPKAKTEAAKPVEPKAKPAARKRDAEPQAPVVRAQAKYVRTSARKARLVCDQIRGKNVEDAYAILAHTPRAVAEDWEKLLKSAVANAEHNHEMVGDDLKIVAAFADEGPTLKRFRPRAMGRATKIRKRTSHLTIQLTAKD